jgi:hypothetical protein
LNYKKETMNPTITGITGSPAAADGNVAADPDAPIQSLIITGTGLTNVDAVLFNGPKGSQVLKMFSATPTSGLIAAYVPTNGSYQMVVGTSDGLVSPWFQFTVE